MHKKTNLIKTVLSALFLALALVLPLFTGQFKQLGNAFCPMHFPVILCGFICGPVYGLAVGIIAPLLRFLIFGLPPLMPTGLAMCVELAVYGLVSGLLYKLLPNRKIYVYVSLICAMLLGRIVWGIAQTVLAGVGDTTFGFAAFLSSAFWGAVPGIALQIILIPLIVFIIKKNFKI